MASIAQSVRQDDPGDDLRIERVAPDRRDEILGLLLSGKPGNCDAAEKFCAFADQHQLGLSELWAAHRGDHAIAATLIVATAGRTAMVFVSPLADWHQVPPCCQLLKTACAAQDPQQATLLQALLDPGQALEAQAIADADFTRLAHLIYMQRQIDPSFRPVTLDADLRVVQWAEQHHDTFAKAILATYENTLDCPGLLGLRQIDDIIAGHQATGTFDGALWTALYDGDNPVAVMLLNLLPPKQAVELVYMGVCPSWRGRGLARKLLLSGLHQAADRHVQHMLLAVDQDNEPAVKLYKSLGFTPTARKLAMIFTLQRPPP